MNQEWYLFIYFKVIYIFFILLFISFNISNIIILINNINKFFYFYFYFFFFLKILYNYFNVKILHYYKSRPLGSQVMRYVPVYTQDSWNNLYFVKMQNFVFVFKTFIDKTYNLYKYRVEEFRISLIQSRLDIPIEEPPVLLRMFAKRDVFALLYVNIKTGNTIFPQIRPGPEIQQKEIINIFWDFYYQTW